jgi:2-polyprenyl-6-hydroxyphenyl methylase/3-demethylubiquinone-9 3-methyltransferase
VERDRRQRRAESACGWCKDKWGVNVADHAARAHRGMTDPDPAARKRVFDAMMTMRKIDIAAIEAARRG